MININLLCARKTNAQVAACTSTSTSGSSTNVKEDVKN